MAVIHVNNHYVPQMYLRNWSNDGNTIMLYRTLVSNKSVEWWSRKSVEGIGYVQHLYTQRIAEEETDEFERWLDKDIEAPAKYSIEKIVDGLRLSKEDYKNLARFIAAQIARTPAYYTQNREQWSKIVSEALDSIVSKTIQGIQHGEIRKHNDLSAGPTYDLQRFPLKAEIIDTDDKDKSLLRVDATVGRSMWLWHIRRVVKISEEILANHNWSVIEVAPGIEWPTSDDPVIRLNYYSDIEYDFRGGINRKGSEILLPISPWHLLYTRVGFGQASAIMNRNENVSELIRKLIMEHAFLQIYSREMQKGMLLYRPRTVDQVQYDRIYGQLRNWHEEQTKGEEGYSFDA